MRIKTVSMIFYCMLAFPVLADAPFVVSANGEEVTDTRTGLIWRRCALGMNLSQNNCTGTAAISQIQVALEMARNQANGLGVAWRLPNIQELSSIADVGRENPAIDTVAFPSTSAVYFWSSTPDRTNPYGAWAVNFDYGGIKSHGYDYLGAKVAHIRLVRTPQ